MICFIYKKHVICNKRKTIYSTSFWDAFLLIIKQLDKILNSGFRYVTFIFYFFIFSCTPQKNLQSSYLWIRESMCIRTLRKTLNIFTRFCLIVFITSGKNHYADIQQIFLTLTSIVQFLTWPYILAVPCYCWP